MAIENTFYQILSSLDISELGGRIYYEFNPNEEDQYLIYQKISHQRPINIDGSPSVENADFQVDIYSKSEDEAKSIRDSLVLSLHGKSFEGFPDRVHSAYVDTDSSGFSIDIKTFRISLTISIYF